VDESEHERRVVLAVLDVTESRLRDPFSLEGLVDVEADLMSTVTAIGVVGNGGLVFWFEGKDAKATRRVAAAFDRLGLTAVADDLRTSLEAFPDKTPPAELAARQLYVSAHRDELKARFRELDERIWAANYFGAAKRYIDRHRDELAALSKEYAAILRLQ
jgi:hypothetical protein